MRVLIVDDDKLFAGILAQLVGVCQHQVVDIVSSGLEAIRSYQKNKPDVVLMDFNMEKLNGLTACRNILGNDPAGRVIFLTGAASDMDLSPAYTGAVAVLSKPIAVKQLKETLDAFAETIPEKYQVVLESESAAAPSAL
jgi:two-component system chemotaxis response regulator CheY